MIKLTDEELIAILRYCGEDSTNPCSGCLLCQVSGCLSNLMVIAADRIEELIKGGETE